jgi:hypothetical protein
MAHLHFLDAPGARTNRGAKNSSRNGHMLATNEHIVNPQEKTKLNRLLQQCISRLWIPKSKSA